METRCTISGMNECVEESNAKLLNRNVNLLFYAFCAYVKDDALCFLLTYSLFTYL